MMGEFQYPPGFKNRSNNDIFSMPKKKSAPSPGTQGAGPVVTDFGPQTISDPLLAGEFDLARRIARAQTSAGNVTSEQISNPEVLQRIMNRNVGDENLRARQAGTGILSAFLPNMEPEMESMTDQEATEFVKAVMEGDTLKQEEIKAKVSKKRPATAKSEPKPKAKTEKKSEGKGQKSPKA
jgi:hypothetical protein